MRTAASLLALAALLALSVWFHGLDLDAGAAPAGPPTPATARASVLGEARDWSFRHVDLETGLVEWEAAGALARPDDERGWTVELPRFRLFEAAGATESLGNHRLRSVPGRQSPPGDPLAATAAGPATVIEAAHGRAVFPRAADAAFFLDGWVRAARAGLLLEASDVTAVLPPGRAEGRLSTRKPVVLRQGVPEAVIRGGALEADARLRKGRLFPPVRVDLDPAALERTQIHRNGESEGPSSSRPPQIHRNGESDPLSADRLHLESDEPMDLALPVGGDAVLEFFGETRGRLARGATAPGGRPQPELTGVAKRGGKVRLGQEKAGMHKARGSGSGTEAEAARRAVAELGDVEIFEGGVPALAGERLSWDGPGALLRLDGRALLGGRGEGGEVVLVRSPRIEYRPDARAPAARLSGPVEASLESATFTAALRAREARLLFAPREGRIAPGELRAVTASGDVEADLVPRPRAGGDPGGELLASPWHLEGDELEIGALPRAGERRASLASIALSGRDRRALLESLPAERRLGWRLEGARIEADRDRGTARAGPLPGTVSRQLLARGPARLEARELRLDERTQRATAEGEVVARLIPEIEPPAPAAAPGAKGQHKSLPEIEIRAARVTAIFEDAAGTPELSEVLADGAPGVPVEVAPADAKKLPADERFLLRAGRAVYDHRTGELRLGGGIEAQFHAKDQDTGKRRPFSLRSREARARLAPGEPGDRALALVEAVGDVHLVEHARLPEPTELRADRALYRREPAQDAAPAVRVLELWGSPLRGSGKWNVGTEYLKLTFADDVGDAAREKGK